MTACLTLGRVARKPAGEELPGLGVLGRVPGHLVSFLPSGNAWR